MNGHTTPLARPRILRGGRVLSMDPRIGELDGDVLIEDGRIIDVAPEIESHDAEVVDCTGSFVLPGFVDTHRHAWQSVVRFQAVGWDVTTYMERGHGKIAPAVSPRDAYLGNLLSAYTCIDAGVTTLCDESHAQHSPAHTDQLIAALRESGVRARFGYGWSAGPANSMGSADPHPRDMERVRNQLLQDDSSLVTMYAMLRGPILSAPDVCREDIQRARDLGLRMSFHAAQTNWPDMREIGYLDEHRLLDSDMCFIHCGAATDDELAVMADRGAGLSVSAAIESRMEGVGIPATARAVAAGLRPSFSVDTEIAVGGDMFGVMRAAYAADQLRRMADEDYHARYAQLTAQDLLEFATIAGARACGLGDAVGSLAPGKRADLILIDRLAPNMLSIADSASAIVEGAHSGNIHAVYVDGQPRKLNGRIVDTKAFGDVQSEVLVAARELLNRIETA